MNRTEILEMARECVSGKRVQDYGTPEDNFDRIARLWSIYLENYISRIDVAMMMSLLKIARVKTGATCDDQNLDNFVDLAGYAACAGEMIRNEE